MVAVVAVPALSHDGSSGPRLDAASRAALKEYDATLMPALVDETVRQAVQDTAPTFEHGTVVAEDDQGHRVERRASAAPPGGSGPTSGAASTCCALRCCPAARSRRTTRTPTAARSWVHAPDLASAEKLWHLDTATLGEIASAPALMFPAPSE
ncbi:MAG: hypothetical protein ABIQ59_00410 [Nocardioidaceae bacterium]